MKAFAVEIITPENTFDTVSAVFLNVPAERGMLTILPGHENYICALRDGMIEIREENGTTHKWKTGRGTMSFSDNTATLLVRHAESQE